MAAKTTENAFTRTADILGAGIDALFAEPDAQYSLIPLDMIEVKIQIRMEFEDEENPLSDLANSIKVHGVLQPIVIRQSSTGYILVAGERRYHASILAGLDSIPAIIRDMTDEEAEDAQLAENIHRKNLTQIEEALKIQRDLDRLGSVEAVLEKHQKSRPWLSKMLSLLNLPEQAKRLVNENVSADVEIITAVKTIEKHNPEKAKALVDDLKITRGKENARDKVAVVKDEVKPSKKTQKTKNEQREQITESKGQGSEVGIFADAKVTSESLETVLADAYMNICENGLNPQTVLEAMNETKKANIEVWLRSFYDLGKQDTDTIRSVVKGVRSRQFSGAGNGALALVAYLHGAGRENGFSVLNILNDVRP
jgi:ParB family transcriptional regulator, chromosome partitioning protein